MTEYKELHISQKITEELHISQKITEELFCINKNKIQIIFFFWQRITFITSNLP